MNGKDSLGPQGVAGPGGTYPHPVGPCGEPDGPIGPHGHGGPLGHGGAPGPAGPCGLVNCPEYEHLCGANGERVGRCKTYGNIITLMRLGKLPNTQYTPKDPCTSCPDTFCHICRFGAP